MSGLSQRSTACPDWETRIVKAQTLIPFEPLFHDAAIEALETFGALKIVDQGDAANAPCFEDVCRPWIKEFVAQIFGSYENDTGKRHITEYFLLISKKNGKSTTAAGIMLTALILNWRQEAEFLILSPTKEIADNSFGAAQAMIAADEDLQALFLVQSHIRTITHLETRAVLKVVAADSNTVSGKKAAGVLIDELWLFGKMANADKMLLEATGGLASRPEGFIIYLTTQSDDPPTGVFKDKLEYARGVRDGTIFDPQFLAVIYEFPMWMLQQSLHKLPENFYVTNPNLTDHPFNDMPNTGSVNVDYIRREWRKAKETGEHAVRIFLAKHLNVEIGLNLRADRWPGADFWEAAGVLKKVYTLEQMVEECEVIAAGVDGGGLDDLLGFAAVGRRREFEWVDIPELFDEDTGITIPATRAYMQRWVIYMHAWAHPSVLSRRKDIESKLRELAKEGTVTLVNRIGQDVDQLAMMVKKLDNSGLLFQIGMDPNCIGGVMDAILLQNVEPEKMVKVNQGYTLGGPIKTAERKIAELVLVHDGNALGNWCVGNAKVKVVGNAIVVTKQLSGTAKIDPLMALFNAVALMSLNPEAQNDQFNEDQMVIAG